MEEHSYTAREVANALGVHINTVRTMVKDGRLSAYKTKEGTGHLRFRQSDIDKYRQEQDLSRISPSLIKKTHLYYANNPSDREKLEKILDDAEDSRLLNHLLDNLDPVRVFGFQILGLEGEEYAKMLHNKAHIWVTSGIANLPTHKDGRLKTGMAMNRTTIGLGVINLGGFRNSVTATVLFQGKNKQLVLDGTLQQFQPDLAPGIVVMEREVAEAFYSHFKEVSIDEYADEMDSAGTPLQDRLRMELFDIEHEG